MKTTLSIVVFIVMFTVAGSTIQRRSLDENAVRIQEPSSWNKEDQTIDGSELINTFVDILSQNSSNITADINHVIDVSINILKSLNTGRNTPDINKFIDVIEVPLKKLVHDAIRDGKFPDISEFVNSVREIIQSMNMTNNVDMTYYNKLMDWIEKMPTGDDFLQNLFSSEKVRIAFNKIMSLLINEIHDDQYFSQIMKMAENMKEALNNGTIPDITQILKMFKKFQESVYNGNIQDITRIMEMVRNLQESIDNGNIPDITQILKMFKKFQESVDNGNIPDITRIMEMLRNPQESIDNGNIPDITQIWKMFKTFQESIDNGNIPDITRIMEMVRNLQESIDNGNIPDINRIMEMVRNFKESTDNGNIPDITRIMEMVRKLQESTDNGNIPDMTRIMEMIRNFKESTDNGNIPDFTQILEMFRNPQESTENGNIPDVTRIMEMAKNFPGTTDINNNVDSEDLNKADIGLSKKDESKTIQHWVWLAKNNPETLLSYKGENYLNVRKFVKLVRNNPSFVEKVVKLTDIDEVFDLVKNTSDAPSSQKRVKPNTAYVGGKNSSGSLRSMLALPLMLISCWTKMIFCR